MLFLIKDSGSTVLMQDNLLRNFPIFMQRLMDPPGLPDLRIAVVTSDLGAGDGSIPGCNSTGGKNGIFQYAPRGTCAATGLEPGATYIADTGTSRNFTGNLADVFTCIADVGDSGCGYEHELAAITRALGADGKLAPRGEPGFPARRCVPLHHDPDRRGRLLGAARLRAFRHDDKTLASPLGPPSSYRCNEFGHLCNGDETSSTGTERQRQRHGGADNCVSAEGVGMLTPVSTMVAQLRCAEAVPRSADPRRRDRRPTDAVHCRLAQPDRRHRHRAVAERGVLVHRV